MPSPLSAEHVKNVTASTLLCKLCVHLQMFLECVFFLFYPPLSMQKVFTQNLWSSFQCLTYVLFCVTSSWRLLDSCVNLDVSCFYRHENVLLEHGLKETEWEVVKWVLLPQNRLWNGFFRLKTGCEMGSSVSEQVVQWVLLPQKKFRNGFFCPRRGCEMGSSASEQVVKWVLLPQKRFRNGFFCPRRGSEMGSSASEQVVKWVLLPQNRNKWQAVVNTVTNLRVS